MTTVAPAKPKNIGPGELADKGQNGESPFLLQDSSFLKIQVYVNNGLALPVTEDSFRTSIKADAGADMSEFAPIINAYKNIRSHVSEWQNTTFPMVVSLASDIVQYNNKVPVFYGAITKLADMIDEDPGNENLTKKLLRLIDNLSQEAKQREENAKHVFDEVSEFANETKQDGIILSGADGKSGLIKSFDDKYGETSEHIKQYRKDQENAIKLLESAEDDYAHDVTVAATTPTYAWFYPIGTISAVVVAGVYGKRATDALETIKTQRAEVSRLSSEIAQAVSLMDDLHFAQRGLFHINESLQRALPAIEKIKGGWKAISDDLVNVGQILKKDIREMDNMLRSLGVDAAIRQWNSIAGAANNYRANAFVSVTP